MAETKRKNFKSRLAVLRKFFRVMGIKPYHVIIPIVLSFFVAAFDGIGLGLLVPIARGIVSDFAFVNEMPVLKDLIAAFPQVYAMTTTPNKNTFLFLVVLVFLATILKNLFLYINSVFTAYWHGIFKYNVYKFIFNRFMSFGKLFFDRTNQGYLVMVLNYSDKVMDLLVLFEKSVERIFTLLVYFVIMYMISWKLTLITLFVFPVLYISLRAIIRKIEEIAKFRNKSFIELHRNVFNILSCVPLVKAYSREEETKLKYADLNEQLKRYDFRTLRVYRLMEPLQDVIVTMVMLLMVSIVALLLAKDKPAEISVFVVFFYAARKVLPLFNIFNQIKADFMQAKPPLKEISKIFDDKDKFFVVEGEKTFEGLHERINVTNLVYGYTQENPVIKGMSFSIEKGKTVALVGPSGAGKTTLISLLMRFYDCPSGSIFIDNTDIREFKLKSLRAHMVLVSQDALLFNDTLRNNLVFGLDRKVSDEELMEALRKSQLQNFVKNVPSGLDAEIGDKGLKLSGGEKQRVAIARAFLKRSEMLILDEATSSLDTPTEKNIQEAINEVIKGRTAVIIAHRLSTVKNADKIIFVEEGKIAEQGSLNELLERKGKFYEYWEAQKFY
ncbi:MAG: ABC transporter ATP-binding protein [Candidatus Omnitrophica bacterium]|nr:ABC transporter ATP-binding protein [Candidatus Omnitrophota bacterium]